MNNLKMGGEKQLKFKIFVKDHPKLVLVRGKFEDFPKFESLIKKVIKNSKLNDFSDFKLHYSEKSLFYFDFSENYPLSQLQGFSDEKTYGYFIDKIKSKKAYEHKFRIILEIKDKLPLFEPKQYCQILKHSLECETKTILEKSEQMPLMQINDQEKIFEKNLKDEKTKHMGIMCYNCFNVDFWGKRFICSECNNYNLCEKCESILAKECFHDKNHVFIQLNSPVSPDLNLDKYSVIYSKQIIFIKTIEDKIKLSVVNNGIKVTKCYITAIRYGKNYLNCDKCEFKELKPNGKYEFSLNFKMPKNANNNEYFEGFFRMFTKEGLPFGDIINVRLVNK